MNKRFGLKVVSIILGIVAWSYVNIIVPPQIKRTVTATITYKNKPELMLIAPLVSKAIVELRGSRRDFIMSSSSKVTASVDLYNLRPGRALVPIKITASSGLEVVSVTPNQINLTATPLARKRLPVEIIVTGEPPEGYIAEAPRIEPEAVIIECPGTLVDKITSCKLEINLDQVKNSVSESKVVEVISNTIIPTENIQIIPPKVRIDVTVKQGYPTKAVPIASLTFINKIPNGKKLDGYSIAPKTIEISGPSRLLKNINSIEAKQIDLSLAKRTTVMSLSFITPKSVKIVGSSSMLLKVKDIKVTRTYTGLSFDVKKTEKQFTEVSVASYSMQIEGFTEDLDRIRDDQLSIILDIKKMKPGKYEVPLSVPAGLSGDLLVKKLTPDKVSILISDLASEAPSSNAPINNISSQPIQIDKKEIKETIENNSKPVE